MCHIPIEEINKTENDRRHKDRWPLKMDKKKEGLISANDYKLTGLFFIVADDPKLENRIVHRIQQGLESSV